MRRVLFTLPLLAGLAAAIVLTMPSVARAWDINALPDGYTIVGHIKNGDCTTYQVRGYGAAIDLSDCRPDFQQALDAWVEQTCPQNVCHPAPATTTAPTVTTTSATTTTVPVTTTDTVPTTTAATTTTVPPVTTDTTATTTTVPPVTTTAQTTTTVPPVTTDTTPVTTTSAAPPAQTVTVTTVITDPSITSRLDLIEQRQVTDEARIAQLEHPVVPGLAPLGEPKNVLPFVA